MELKGSKTEKNLMEAFAGESQARNKYTYLLLLLKKRVINKSLLFLRKPQITKKNTLKCGLRL